ncbi:MAG: hypothetical protein DRO98_07475 [Archaeoglobales archaeon]|nr:MAG: hypothetical protein DRO98_07475 [Archaeoglobales archaeon]
MIDYQRTSIKQLTNKYKKVSRTTKLLEITIEDLKAHFTSIDKQLLFDCILRLEFVLEELRKANFEGGSDA